MKSSVALRLNSSLNVYQVASQGTFLSDRRRVWLRTRLFGREKFSKKHSPTFPIVFNETYEIERTFTNARNLATLADILAVEAISIDLVQHSDKQKGGQVLAHYESSVQDFLFPNARHAAGGINFVPMGKSRKIKHPIQLSYSTQTHIEEVSLGKSTTRFSDPMQQAEVEPQTPPTRSEPSPAFHSTPKPINVSPGTSIRSATSQRQLEPHPVTRTGLWATLKTSSEAKRPRVQFFDDTRLSTESRPPFVVRRVDRLDRRSGGKCSVEADQSLVGGSSLPEVSVIKHPNRRLCELEKMESSREEEATLLREKSLDSSDSILDETLQRPSLEYSIASRRGDTDTSRPAQRCRRVKFALDPAQRIHAKIDDLLKTCCHCGKDDDDDVELELANSLEESVAKRLKVSRYTPEEDVTVHLGDNDYWSTRMRKYTGKPHRLLFDETLEKAYKRLYERAKRMD